MLFERFDDKGLAQYSYIVACEGASVAAVVDPRRDVDVYLAFAAARRLRITHVLETHIHADFASGARELAYRTGAELHLSAYDQGELYTSQIPHVSMTDGAVVTIGRVRIQALHTPGHTPEHLSFLLFDTARSREVPQVLLSGDFLFVGSFGRPDLIGDDVKRQLAGRVFESVRRLDSLPDGLEIHPGHGAGSMCGAGMSARPMSTLGFERLANPLLGRPLSQDSFVDRLLQDLPPFPPYYRRMKVLNSAGPPLLDHLPGADLLSPLEVHDLVAAGAVVIDLRDQVSFGGGHVPGSFGIGWNGSLSMWAGWVVPYDTPIVLVAAEPVHAREAVRGLVRVGLDDVRGVLDGGIPAWVDAGYELATTQQMTARDAHARLAQTPAPSVIDVRSTEEWSEGHICGATHVLPGDLASTAAVVAQEQQMVAVVCGSGYRSTVASSVLARAGARGVINITGGMAAWQNAGLPMCKDDE